MKRKYITEFLGLLCCVIVSSAGGNNGSVKMQGSIIATPCVIDTGSRDQTIDMGSIPITQIIRDGQGPVRPFVIRLVNCVLEQSNSTQSQFSWQYFRITFDGPHSYGLFDVMGQAKGVGLQIQRKSDGEIAIPGQGMSVQGLQAGTNNLIYQLRLVANHHSLTAGLYSSQLRFKLDYE